MTRPQRDLGTSKGRILRREPIEEAHSPQQVSVRLINMMFPWPLFGMERRRSPIRGIDFIQQTGGMLQSTAQNADDRGQRLATDLKILGMLWRKLDFERHDLTPPEVLPVSFWRNLRFRLDRPRAVKVRRGDALKIPQYRACPAVSYEDAGDIKPTVFRGRIPKALQNQ